MINGSVLYAGAMMLIPGRRNRAGGENSSPRSILVKRPRRARARSTHRRDGVDYEEDEDRDRDYQQDRFVAPISDDPEGREGQGAFDRPRSSCRSARPAASPAREPRERRTSDSPARTAVSRSGSRSAFTREPHSSRIVVRAQRAGRGAPNGRMLVSRCVGERFRKPLASDLSQDCAAAIRTAAARRRASARAAGARAPARRPCDAEARCDANGHDFRAERVRRTPAQLPGRRRAVRHRRLPARHDQAIEQLR